MELDKQTIKSISSDTRVEILKSLARRRKMPSELSKQLELAPSTIAEHLKILENSKLIKRTETGHKWIYYELNDKGKALVAPQYKPQFVIVLVLGSLLVLGGFAGYLTPYWHAEPIPQFDFLDSIGMQASLEANESLRESDQEASDITNDLNTKAIMDKVENIETKNTNLYVILLFAGAVLIVLSFAAPRKYILETT